MGAANSILLFSVSLSILLSAAGASYLAITGPVQTIMYNNGTVSLGNVAPGESFYVLASASTTNQSGFRVNLGWNTFQAVSLPQRWSSQSSPYYGDPMKLRIAVSPNATPGRYKLILRAVNLQNYSRLGNLTFNAYVNVTTNIYNFSVSPTQATTGLGQPVNLKVVIANNGISDDPFLINIVGLAGWNLPVQVISTHGTTGTYFYPVFVSTPQVYNFNITIISNSSPQLRQAIPITLTSKPSVLNDYSATGQGVVLSPIIYEPAYALMLLVSDIYHLIFH